MTDIIKKKERKNWFYSYNMIWDQPLSEHAKIAYLYLCRCADDNGQAFPSHATIAQKCSISRQTTINALNELKNAGLLSCKQRKDSSGSLTSNLYTIFDVSVLDKTQNENHPCPPIPSS